MNATLSVLQGELERLFTMNELLDLSRSLLGFDPETFGGASIGKAAFVRRMVDHCERDQATIALADAVNLTKSGMVDPRLKQVYSASYDEELAPGALVGPYEVVEAAGAFSLGRVYVGKVVKTEASSCAATVAESPGGDHGAGEPAEAEPAPAPAEEEPPRLVRLEVVSSALTPDGRAVRRYVTALRAMQRLEHPNLPKILDVGVLGDGRPWAALEPVGAARPWSELFAEHPMTLVDAWPVLRQVLRALAALHEAGLAHGDVKVENVLVELPAPGDPGPAPAEGGEGAEAAPPRPEPRVWLVGLASDRLFSRPSRDDKEAGPLSGAGTPKCMAPEQARGKMADRRTDLYALGTLFYEVLTGRTLFTGRTGIDIVARHLLEEPKAPSAWVKDGLPKALDDLVLGLVAKDPLRRPGDLAPVVKQLEVLVADMADAARPPTGSVEDVQAAVDAFFENPCEEACDTVEETARDAKAWDLASEAYEHALELLEDQALLSSILYRLGRIYMVETREHERAEKIYRTILEKTPDDPRAEQALADLRRATGKFDELIEMLLKRLEKLTDGAERTATLRDIATIYETEVNKPDEAFTVLLAVLQAVQDEKVLDDLARLAGLTGRWNDLVQACSAVMQSVQDPNTVVLIAVRMGRWYGEMLGRQDYALPCYQQALAIEPTNDDALRGMEEIFRRQQQWLELSQVLLTRAEAAAYPEQRRDRLTEAAAIFADRLSDNGRAVELYKAVLADDPAHEKAVDALERIYVRTESWDELIRLYIHRDEALTDPVKKAETRFDIAEVFEDRLNNDAAAIDAHKKALQIDPHYGPTLKALERLYAKTGDFRELLDVLATQLEIAATPRQRVTLLARRAQILEEEFHQRDEALGEYAKLIAIEPKNEEALGAIARLQRSLERWAELDLTLERHVAVSEDKERRIALLQDWSKLLVKRLEDPARAAKVLTQLAELQPESAEVLDGLAKQRLLASDVAGAIEALRRLADVTKDGPRRSALWVKIGELYEQKLEDAEQAEAAYRKAIDADKANVTAAAALQARYAQRGDMTAAFTMLERQLEAAEGDLERSRIYTKMGKLCREALNQPARAVEYFEKALGCDASNAEAAEPLAEIHRAAGRWDAAAAIYEHFSDAVAAMPADKKLEFFKAWGEASIQINNLQKAELAFRSAIDVAPEDRDAARRLADVYFKAEVWKAAATQYGAVVEKFGESLDDDARAELQLQQGMAQHRAGDLADAGATIDAVLAIKPQQLEALRHRADIHKERKEFAAAAEVVARLAEASAEGDDKIAALTELGDLYTEELVEHEKAAAAYSTALASRPDDRNLLTRLMKSYSSTKQWPKLVEVVLKIADMESDAIKMARYYQTAAMIADKELGRVDEAREYYETAVEHDPSLLKSFEALADILQKKEEWEELAAKYTTMLGRLPKDTDTATQVKMLDALAGVLQNQLNKPAEAITYYEKALALDPDDRPRRETLARLYGTEASAAQKAIQTHLQLLQLNPFRAESYRALRKIYASTNQWDQQWCVARTLVSLHMADEEEDALFKQYKSDEIPSPGDCLTDEQWQNYLLHKEQDRNITSIFETIMPAVLQTQGRPHKSYGVDLSQARNLDTDDHPLSQLVKFTSATLGMTAPPVFFSNTNESVIITQTNPPALLAGKPALDASYRNPKALAYIVGRWLAYLRGGNLMRYYIESGTMMRAWLLAALKHVQPKIPIPQDMAGTVTSCGTKLSQGLGPKENESLRLQVLSFISSAAKVDLKQWATAVDYGADRAGFLLCDDLDIASQLIRLEKDSATPTKDRLKELNLFSVSPEYFALRKKLAIQLWPCE